jgi:Family of unknown function (DUF6478)
LEKGGVSMAKQLRAAVTRVLHARVLKRWQRISERTDQMTLSTLRQVRGRARELGKRLDHILFVADGRLTLPLIGSNALVTPLHTDWSYRPELWRGPVRPSGRAAVENKARLGHEATIFHDCKESELTLRQMRNTREEDLAPFGMRLDVFRFDGSFLSLVLDLPDAAREGLQKRHVFRLTAVVEVEKPIEMFVRLNIRHGPNTEQLVEELPLGEEESFVEFDLAYSRLNEKRIDHIWVDLIFEAPEMNQVMLRDVTLSRRPRAEF